MTVSLTQAPRAQVCLGYRQTQLAGCTIHTAGNLQCRCGMTHAISPVSVPISVHGPSQLAPQSTLVDAAAACRYTQYCTAASGRHVWQQGTQWGSWHAAWRITVRHLSPTRPRCLQMLSPRCARSARSPPSSTFTSTRSSFAALSSSPPAAKCASRPACYQSRGAMATRACERWQTPSSPTTLFIQAHTQLDHPQNAGVHPPIPSITCHARSSEQQILLQLADT